VCYAVCCLILTFFHVQLLSDRMIGLWKCIGMSVCVRACVCVCVCMCVRCTGFGCTLVAVLLHLIQIILACYDTYHAFKINMNFVTHCVASLKTNLNL
jgi:hypothetical protein